MTTKLDSDWKHPKNSFGAASGYIVIRSNRQPAPAAICQRYPETRLWEAPNSDSKMLAKVNSLWPNSRCVIALHSPSAPLQTGLHMCPAEKSRDSDPLRCRAVRSLQSGLPRNYREKWAYSAHFEGKGGDVSLQLRLAGGARSLALTFLWRIPC